ncbi:hypothetical protein AB4Z32_25465 [Massilia sp. 2TAF26]|uniref:hypothetical protein n=1 Tax=Massilia sp. 2TAF26 TaxID=3233012 RepID=UPI003F9E2FEF
MTRTLIIGPEQQRLEGRTVRDIVEHDPAQVNEVWCRKIFRQLLQSLELQYAMRMPHRAITPDTVVFHDNGEPLLIPTELDDVQDEAADLTALARVVHFAITRELAPTGPLQGRAPEGYSDSLITAVDRCMSSDPAERPRSIDELRHILGIVSLGPAMPAAPAVAPAPATMPFRPITPLQPDADVPAAARKPLPAIPVPDDSPPSFMREGGATRLGGLSRWQRWALAGGGGAFLVAVALALFAELRDSGSYDHIVLTLPQTGEQAHRDAASAPPPLAQAEPHAPASDATASAPAPAEAAEPAPAAMPPAAFTPAPAAPGVLAAPAQPQAGPAASATYKLAIKPWGVVYVDGVDRGVSPPVKRLTLTPGKHTIRVANPNFHDRVLEVDTGAGSGQIAVDFSDAPR